MSFADGLQQGMFLFLVVRGALLVLQVLLRLRRERSWGDMGVNLACGALIYAIFQLGMSAVVYSLSLQISSWRITNLPVSPGIFLLSLLGADLGFYLYHRSAHASALLWADHSVHHSSPELDLTTGLRASPLVGFYGWLFSAPLLLLGVHPFLFATSLALVNDYPFLLHTTHIRRLPAPIELIFNTPAHHRQHHARNARAGQNLAGIFIIWDRIFGTFAPSEDQPEFGIEGVDGSRNLLRILTQGWYSFLRDASQRSTRR